MCIVYRVTRKCIFASLPPIISERCEYSHTITKWLIFLSRGSYVPSFWDHGVIGFIILQCREFDRVISKYIAAVESER